MDVSGILNNGIASATVQIAGPSKKQIGSGLFSRILEGVKSKSQEAAPAEPTRQPVTSNRPGIGPLPSAGNVMKRQTASSAKTNVENLGADSQRLLDDFQTRANQLLAANGIDLSQPIRLQGDAFGGIQVANEHPDKQAIEQLLSANFDVMDAFHKLGANFTALRDAALGRALGREPAASALGEASKSLLAAPDRTPPKFNLTLRNGRADVSFL